MFNKKGCFLALFLIFSNYSTDLMAWDSLNAWDFRRPPVESSSTLQDLNAIAATQSQSLEEFFEEIEDKGGIKFEALKVGKDLFKRALLLEENLKSSDYTVWWRVSHKALDHDITSQRGVMDRSFGVSLLAGYIQDGINGYGRAACCAPNMYACVYIYYANALFAQSILDKRRTVTQDFLNFIQENGFLSAKNDKIIKLKEFIQNLDKRAAEFETQKQAGTLVSYIQQTSAGGEKKSETRPVYPSTTEESDLLLDLTISIQEDLKYELSRHRTTIDDLYQRRLELYLGDEMDISNAALNNVYALILPKATASSLINGQIKFGTEAVLYGRGEKFHPRIPLETYEELKGNVINVYSDLKLIDEETLKQEITRIIQ
ncbi:MAG: hypothetical protein K0M45_01880 [Candidatus Paracaedibacteraceae bacterium]|nr:hypothetical protein [Candidatus Paracaedibacteraceae bacterium]